MPVQTCTGLSHEKYAVTADCFKRHHDLLAATRFNPDPVRHGASTLPLSHGVSTSRKTNKDEGHENRITAVHRGLICFCESTDFDHCGMPETILSVCNAHWHEWPPSDRCLITGQKWLCSLSLSAETNISNCSLEKWAVTAVGLCWLHASMEFVFIRRCTSQHRTWRPEWQSQKTQDVDSRLV